MRIFKGNQFIDQTPDPNFSPARNKAIINRTIKKYEEIRAKKMKEFKEGLGERSEAVASFLQHVKDGKDNKIEKYFTPKMLAHLRGEDIVDTLRAIAGVYSPPPKIYVGDGVIKNSKGDIVGREVSNVKKAKKELG